MEQRYINDFFNSGIIRISSFRKFASYNDEQFPTRKDIQRSDPLEGSRILTIATPNQTTFAVLGPSPSAYILSTSILESHGLKKKFKTNGYFEIFDVCGFSEAVSESVSDCVGGWIGPCKYVNDLFVRAEYELTEAQQFNDAILSHDLSRMSKALLNIGGAETNYFLKRAKFKHQFEYRIVWECTKKWMKLLLLNV